MWNTHTAIPSIDGGLPSSICEYPITDSCMIRVSLSLSAPPDVDPSPHRYLSAIPDTHLFLCPALSKRRDGQLPPPNLISTLSMIQIFFVPQYRRFSVWDRSTENRCFCSRIHTSIVHISISVYRESEIRADHLISGAEKGIPYGGEGSYQHRKSLDAWKSSERVSGID